MKKTRSLSLLFTAILLMSLMAVPAMAQYPEDLVFVPVSDPSVWEVESGENFFAEMGNADQWINASVDNGSLVLAHSDNPGKANTWPRVRTPWLAEDDLVLIDLAKTPYLIYDFDMVGTGNWMIMFYLDQAIQLRLANVITKNAGMPALEGDDPDIQDGFAGSYKGVLDLNAIAGEMNLAGFKANGKYDLTSVNIFLVGSDASSKLTVRDLRLSDSADAPAPAAEGATTEAAPAATTPAAKPSTSTPAKTFDPGVAMMAVTGLAGLAGAGLLIKKRK